MEFGIDQPTCDVNVTTEKKKLISSLLPNINSFENPKINYLKDIPDDVPSNNDNIILSSDAFGDTGIGISVAYVDNNDSQSILKHTDKEELKPFAIDLEDYRDIVVAETGEDITGELQSYQQLEAIPVTETGFANEHLLSRTEFEEVNNEPYSILGSPITCDYINNHIVEATYHQTNTSPSSQVGTMGIENTWRDDCFPVPPVSSLAIPLPAPDTPFDDFSACTSLEGVTHGPYSSDLDALFSANENETDITDLTADPGICGLRNLGNTCFMSTGVQCLAATKSLVNFFRTSPITSEFEQESLISEFTSLINKMWSGDYSVVSPSSFKQSLGNFCPQFKDFSQHDCQEFLALLLDGLHQQLMEAVKCNIRKTANSICFTLENIPGNSNNLCNKMSDSWVLNVNSEENSHLFSDFMTSNTSNSTTTLGMGMDKDDVFYGKPIDEDYDEYDTKGQSNSKDDIMAAEVTSFVNQFFEGIKSDDNKEKLNNVTERAKENEMLKNTNQSNLNNFRSTNYTGLEEYLKEAKTSNVNVLVTETEANNEIRFDSSKFPKIERRRNGMQLNELHLHENNTNGKRGKSITKEYNTTADFRDEMDLKRLKMNDIEKENNLLIKCPEKNIIMENERKLKAMNVDTEGYDFMDLTLDTDMESSGSDKDDSTDLEMDDIDGERHWNKHMAGNDSIIFDLFQGQFKNTIVCSACKFRSVTYEPFMYLSVPLPNAIEKQICVTYVSAEKKAPVKYLVTVNKQDDVLRLKNKLFELGHRSVDFQIVIAEVLEYHIAKILDDSHQVRYIDDINRKVYAFEQFVVPSMDTFENTDGESSENNNSVPIETCSICLEDKETGIRRHRDCTCILCDVCVQNTFQHYGEKTLCPVCRVEMNLDRDLVPTDCEGLSLDAIRFRTLSVPIVYRVDKIDLENNNSNAVKLFGYPSLLKCPNTVYGAQLYNAVSSIQPYDQQYKLLFVDGQGKMCSRCMRNKHCNGCIVPKDGKVTLTTSDSLAVVFSIDVTEMEEVQHDSMVSIRPTKTLTLYDCVDAFSQSEILDEYNPWHCPKCKKNQCATKTLSIHRFPSYLIVYLKRFVFYECNGIKLEDKVEFPLNDFKFKSKEETPYDLYACVCHTGGVSVGHYTAYTQHLDTKEWYCFNDENVCKMKPQEEEYSNAYILFYKKQVADTPIFIDEDDI